MAQGTTKASKEKPLYDFIYIDKNRLYSLVSQLSEGGLLTQQVFNRSSSDKSSSTKQNVSKKSAQVNAGVAKAGIGADKGGSITEVVEAAEAIQDHFNTEHIAPIFLIDSLIESKLASRKLNSDHGMLIHLKGNISIKDTSILKDFYRPLRNFIPIDELEELDFDSMMEVIEVLPHQIHFSLKDAQGTAWSTLDPKYFLVDHSDFLSKHGLDVAGDWECLAIMDRKPSDVVKDTSQKEITKLDGMLTGAIGNMRAFFGMDDTFFGVTPIAIFRRLSTF